MQEPQKWREGQKETNTGRVKHAQRTKTPPILYPTNTWKVGHGSRYSEGVIWR